MIIFMEEMSQIPEKKKHTVQNKKSDIWLHTVSKKSQDEVEKNPNIVPNLSSVLIREVERRAH